MLKYREMQKEYKENIERVIREKEMNLERIRKEKS